MVETKVVPEALRVGNLVTWCRYHDDVLAICKNRVTAHAITRKIKSAAEPVFDVVVEGVYSLGKVIEYLDLVLYFDRASLRCEAAQSKPVTPLCFSSSHSGSVHFSWPWGVLAYIHSVY